MHTICRFRISTSSQLSNNINYLASNPGASALTSPAVPSYAYQPQSSQVILADNTAASSYQQNVTSSSFRENQYGPNVVYSQQQQQLSLGNSVSSPSTGIVNLNPPIQYYVNEPMLPHSNTIADNSDEIKNIKKLEKQQKPVVIQRFRDSQLKVNLAAPSRAEKLSGRGEKLSDGGYVINLSGLEDHEVVSSLQLTTSAQALKAAPDTSTLFLDEGASNGFSFFKTGEILLFI
jgi:hypothetical protein